MNRPRKGSGAGTSPQVLNELHGSQTTAKQIARPEKGMGRWPGSHLPDFTHERIETQREEET